MEQRVTKLEGDVGALHTRVSVTANPSAAESHPSLSLASFKPIGFV